MGFAASQARLLLLTARKSDLEFRAQQITNAEMMLAMRSEEVANKYSRRISNQTVKIIDGNQELPINATTLAQMGYSVKKKNADGSLEAWNPGSENAEPQYKRVFNQAKLDAAVEAGSITKEQAETIKNGALPSFSASRWAAVGGTLTLGDGTQIDLTPYYDEVPDYSAYSTGDDYGAELLEGVNRGQFVVYNAAGEEISLSNGTGFVTCYDTSDDEEADAEYRRETAAIQVKEKRLQMEMKQIEAQQKACENEIESAKKLQDKNADSMFKYMS